MRSDGVTAGQWLVGGCKGSSRVSAASFRRWDRDDKSVSERLNKLGRYGVYIVIDVGVTVNSMSRSSMSAGDDISGEGDAGDDDDDDDPDSSSSGEVDSALLGGGGGDGGTSSWAAGY